MFNRLVVTALALLASAGASATVIYETDLSADSSALSGGTWSAGQYAQNTTDDVLSLSLNDPAIGSSVDLVFDLIAIGTWDQAGPLADSFELSTTVLSGTMETIFTTVLFAGVNTVSFSGIETMAAGALEILFSSAVTFSDELFAISQLSVSASNPGPTPFVVAVPEPGTLVLLGLGLLGAGLRRFVPVRG